MSKLNSVDCEVEEVNMERISELDYLLEERTHKVQEEVKFEKRGVRVHKTINYSEVETFVYTAKAE
jgi:hypothetical protein